MTNIVSGNGSTSNYQTYDDTQLQQATKTLDQQPTDTMDSVSSVNGLGNSYTDAYVNPPGKAQLPQPTSNQPTSMGQIVGGLKELQNGAKANASDLTQQLTDLAGQQKVYYGAAGDLVNALTEEQLQEIAYQPGMSSEDIKEEVFYALQHPEADVPENVRQIADQIHASALSTAQQTLGADWEPASLAWIQDAAVMMSMQGYFNSAIEEIPGLSKADIAELHFAMENPDAASSLSPRLQAIFKQVMGKATAGVQKNFGVPNGWSFPSDKHLPTSLESAFDYKFEKALGNQVESGKLTEKQAQQLKTLHYNPNADIPNANKLKGQLSEIEGGVLQGLQEKWGFPAGYRPTTASSQRDAMVNLMYQSTFDQLLNSYSLPSPPHKKLQSGPPKALGARPV